MGKTGNMRRRARVDEPVASIPHHVGVSEPTAGSAKMVGLSPEPPGVRQPVSDALDPYEGTAGLCSTTTAGTGVSSSTPRCGST